MDANRRPAGAGDARRGKGNDGPIVVLRDERTIPRDELRHGAGHLPDNPLKIQTNDFQRAPQPSHVFVKPKHLAAKRTQPLGHRGAQQEANVIDGNAQIRCWEPTHR